MYLKNDFGRELAAEINQNFDLKKIAKWAHDKYLDYASVVDPETHRAMMIVIAMAEGEEFFLTKEQLLKLAADLQNSH